MIDDLRLMIEKRLKTLKSSIIDRQSEIATLLGEVEAVE